jgi:hypothetical protein
LRLSDFTAKHHFEKFGVIGIGKIIERVHAHPVCGSNDFLSEYPSSNGSLLLYPESGRAMSRQARGLGADIQDQAAFAMAGRVHASYESDLRQIIMTGKEPREWAAAALGFHPVSVCRMAALHS